MANLDSWLAGESLDVTSAASRAALAWRRIQDRPTPIIITRAGSARAVQTVRIESDNTATDHLNPSTNQITANQKVTVFGIRDHATLADTDITRSDRFSLNGVGYEVIAVMTPPGEVQAVCEARRAS